MGEILFAIGEMILQHTIYVLASWTYGTEASPRPAWIRHTIRTISVTLLIFLSVLVLNAYSPDINWLAPLASTPDVVLALTIFLGLLLLMVMWAGEAALKNMGWFYGTLGVTLTIAIAAIVANFV